MQYILQLLVSLLKFIYFHLHTIKTSNKQMHDTNEEIQTYLMQHEPGKIYAMYDCSI